MNHPPATQRDKCADCLEAILDFAVALTTLLSLAWVSACVLGLAQDTVLDNAMVQAAIDNWADRLDNSLRLIAAGVRYMTGGK